MTAVAVTRRQVLEYRARRQHLDAKLPRKGIASAAYGGLQDSAPRSGVLALHARVEQTEPGDWEHPDLAQIWFRGGADYVIPRDDIGIFTLGSRPRDDAKCERIDALADAALRILDGEVMKVREVTERMPALTHPLELKSVYRSGRLLIRWNASMIWLIAHERPDIDDEDARRGLARRFLRWHGPQTVERFAWWAAIEPKDAKATWRALDAELIAVAIDGGKERSLLKEDLDALEGAGPIDGVRLLPFDDPFTKLDRDLLIPGDDEHRSHAFPPVGTSRGYIPGAVLVDGEIRGVWARQQRAVTIHAWDKRLPKRAIEAEALSVPISSASKPSVRWA